MNNIDILEEKEKKAIELLKQEPDFSLSYYKRENAIDIVLKLVETLISENKELKEKNNELEVINKMQEYRITVIDERELISKSKIEEKIEEYEKDYDRQDKEGLYNLTKITSGKIASLRELLDERNNTDV